jgi:hypothetical protein
MVHSFIGIIYLNLLFWLVSGTLLSTALVIKRKRLINICFHSAFIVKVALILFNCFYIFNIRG